MGEIISTCAYCYGVGKNQGNGIEYLKTKEEGGANLVFPERMSSLMGFFPQTLTGNILRKSAQRLIERIVVRWMK